MSFTVVSSGFTNPTYQVVDSFGGGANNSNINGYGDFNWTPNNSDIGSHTITVTVSDSLGDSATASQTITVTAPVISVSSVSPSATVMYGNGISFTISSTGFLSPQYSVADSFGYSSVTSSDTTALGAFYWTPVFQDIGVHTLVATARDYLGHLASTSVVVTVTGPVGVTIGAISPPGNVYPGQSISFNATTTGMTSPTLSIKDAFSSTLGTSSLAIDSTGRVTWTPVYNDIGAHVITVTATDASGHSASASVPIQVLYGTAPVSSAPVVPNTVVTTASTAASTSPATNISNAKAYVFTKYLQTGSSGADVTALQQLLLTLGFFATTPSGYFGTITMHAVQAYQTAHGISPLGVVGPLTRTSLNTGR